MKISFSCPYCGKKLSAADTSVGQAKTCPNCRGKVVVPTAMAAANAEKKGPKKPRVADDHPILLMGKHTDHGDLIDMTAMVDIVFFLLIFFLVTSMQSIEAVLDLPAPQAASAANSVQVAPDISNDPAYVAVTLDADDAIFVEGEEILSEQDLRSKLRAAVDDGNAKGMMIKVSGDATHGKFVMILDAGADARMSEIMFSVSASESSEDG